MIKLEAKKKMKKKMKGGMGIWNGEKKMGRMTYVGKEREGKERKEGRK